MNQLKGLKYDQLHIVFGVVADKDPMPVLKLLPQDAEYYFTQATIQRALSAEVLTQKAKEIGLTGSAFYRVALAFDAAIKHSVITSYSIHYTKLYEMVSPDFTV